MSCCGVKADPSLDIASVVADINKIRVQSTRREELLGFLSERSPIYVGLGTRLAERLRGYVFASFAIAGLPVSAMKIVMEEIETGQDPYAVAGAAIALRGSPEAGGGCIELLTKAARRLAARDEYVRYESFELVTGPDARRTALQEIEDTIAHLTQRGPFAVTGDMACCCSPAPSQSPAKIDEDDHDALMESVLEDQSGSRVNFKEFFWGRPSILTFFYTRCMNPERCSLTITKLARLQQIIRQRERSNDINVAAISYDPLFDNAERLRIYGADRSMTFDDRNKLLRTPQGFDALRDTFELNVSYGPSTVNRHGVELLVLDKSARVRHEFRRAKWDVAVAVDFAEHLL